MTNITDIQNLVQNYNFGHRYFINLDFDKGEKLTRQILTDTIFDNCCFSVDFSETDFTPSREQFWKIVFVRLQCEKSQRD
jgi:hypothetical protein